jgi:hypothetical protein
MVCTVESLESVLSPKCEQTGYGALPPLRRRLSISHQRLRHSHSSHPQKDLPIRRHRSYYRHRQQHLRTIPAALGKD